MIQDTLSRVANAPLSDSDSMDYTLFRAINGLAGRSHVLDGVMVALAKYSPLVYAVALVLLWLTWKQRNQRAALLAGISALVALGLGQLIGYAFPRDRPYLAHHVSLLITHSPDTSFPSDHTTLAFAIAAAVWQFNRRAGTALLVFGALVAIARVFVGAHYPGDAIGGAVPRVDHKPHRPPVVQSSSPAPSSRSSFRAAWSDAAGCEGWVERRRTISSPEIQADSHNTPAA